MSKAIFKTEKRIYWIRFIHVVCVLCGNEKTYRTKIYDLPKPTEFLERHEFRDKACCNHF